VSVKRGVYSVGDKLLSKGNIASGLVISGADMLPYYFVVEIRFRDLLRISII